MKAVVVEIARIRFLLALDMDSVATLVVGID
jgi:hypothetical protein